MSVKTIVPMCLLVLSLGALFTSCDDISGSVVSFDMKFPAADTAPYVKFRQNMETLFVAFAKEYGKFQYKGANDPALKATHTVTLAIDSVNLIDPEVYKKVLEKVNPHIVASGIIAEVASLGGGGSARMSQALRSMIMQSITKGIYASNPIPMLWYHLSLKDLKTGEAMVNEIDSLETFSFTPITPQDQLSQMLSILNGKVRDKIPYFDD
jgi:hypothetical protein